MKNKKSIDLHIHTTFSDGSFTPLEVINLAKKANLSAISITDHDTIDGCKEALKYLPNKNLNFITGIEISAAPPISFSNLESLHILGYGIDINNKHLKNLLKIQKQKRDTRNEKICEKLKTFGIEIDINKIKKSKNLVGRPHIAKEMLDKKYVKTIESAFVKFLKQGKIAYVSKENISYAKVLWTIKKANGISSFAHPFLLKLSIKNFEKLLIILKENGLNALEVYYPNIQVGTLNKYKALAEKHNLLETGGSDFHGQYKKNIKLGKIFIPFEVYEKCVCGTV